MTLELATYCGVILKGIAFTLKIAMDWLAPYCDTLCFNCNVCFLYVNFNFSFYLKSLLADLDQHADINMLLGLCYC